MKVKISILIISALIGAGCTFLTDTGDDNPAWIDPMIARFESAPMGNPPQTIWRYEYKGRTVYYIPAQCCDQFSELYDEHGNYMGAPDGGFSGQGDRRYPDFLSERKNGKLIWSDPRDRRSA